MLLPQHDFHTSWMNITHNEEEKVLEIDWRTDTEHLEYVLTNSSGIEINLEPETIQEHHKTISNYIDDHVKLKLNGTTNTLRLSFSEVNFSETTLHFKPVKCKEKLNNVAMDNTLLISDFPNQKNMVQLNYKGNMYSLLFGNNQKSGIIEIK